MTAKPGRQDQSCVRRGGWFWYEIKMGSRCKSLGPPPPQSWPVLFHPHTLKCVTHQCRCSFLFSFSVPSEDGLVSSFALEICPQPLSVESRGTRSPPTLVQFKLGMQGRRPAIRGPGPKEFPGSLICSGQCFLCDISEQKSIGGWGLGTRLFESADGKHIQCE